MSKEILETRVNSISTLVFDFCDQKLDKEYLELAEKLIGKLKRKRPSPLLKGRENIWAAGIVHALGQTNFLSDKSFEPYVSFNDLNDFFETKKSSVGNKAAEIRKMFKMDQLTNYEFMLESQKKHNPLYNMVTVNGLFVSISSLPEPYQTIAREAKAQGKDIHFSTK
jgi:hypothetical protein